MHNESATTVATHPDESEQRQTHMITRFADRVNPKRIFCQESEDGQAIVEYSLIFVLIIIVCFSILMTLSDTVDEKLFQVVKMMP